MESKNENLLEVKMIMWKAAWKMENHEDEAGLRGAQNTDLMMRRRREARRRCLTKTCFPYLRHIGRTKNYSRAWIH